MEKTTKTLKKILEIVRNLRVKAASFTPYINGNWRGKPAGARNNGIKTCQKSCTKVSRVGQKTHKNKKKILKNNRNASKKVSIQIFKKQKKTSFYQLFGYFS